MADNKKPQPSQTDTEAPAAAELNNPDFQAVLKALLAVYQPILQQQLSLANDPAELQKEAEAAESRTCAQEFKEAYAMFERFHTEETAIQLLPAQAKELLGPVEEWRWCLAAHPLLRRIRMACLPLAAQLPRLRLLPLRILEVRTPGHWQSCKRSSYAGATGRVPDAGQCPGRGL